MKKQFLHDHHRRLDKALKPDYREEMYGSGRSGAAPLTAVKATAFQAENAKKQEVLRLRKATFRYKGIKFRFGWDLKVFANSNKLPLADVKTSEAFQKMCMIADKDFHAISDAINCGQVGPYCYKGRFLYWLVKWSLPRTTSSVGFKQNP